MITDNELYSLAIFLGSLSMLLIILYHYLEVNALDTPRDSDMLYVPKERLEGNNKKRKTEERDLDRDGGGYADTEETKSGKAEEESERKGLESEKGGVVGDGFERTVVWVITCGCGGLGKKLF